MNEDEEFDEEEKKARARWDKVGYDEMVNRFSLGHVPENLHLAFLRWQTDKAREVAENRRAAVEAQRAEERAEAEQARQADRAIAQKATRAAFIGAVAGCLGGAAAFASAILQIIQAWNG